ncbi:MAG: MopE-related protein [Pseudomonadota bacterium]|nr:MopE-related protein [Pseudomonadota bacterium]
MRNRLPFAAAFAIVGGFAVLTARPPSPERVVAVTTALPPTPNAVLAGGAGVGSMRPAPTEHRLGAGAEKRSNAGRREWHKRMHRAGSGVEWERIEQENGLAQVRRHKQIKEALEGAPPAPTDTRWVERGSSNQAGRTHVARLSTDGAELYVGSALGGLWRGTLDGQDWEPLGDDTYGGVHFAEVVPAAAPGDPDVLVVATDGGIVLRSVDDGATWAAVTGLGSPWWVRRLTQASDGSGTLYLLTASNDGVWLWRSTDAGATWAGIRDLAGYYGDLYVPRDGDGAIWLLDGATVRTSADRGDTWTELGMLPAASGTGDLVGSEAGAPTLYAVLDTSSLWRSDDAGVTWASLGAMSDYWGGSLAVSSVDPDLFAFGAVELHVSRDGGGTFTTRNAWWEYYDFPASTLHADIQGVDVIPDGVGGETWYVNTDGGTYRSYDGLVNVENLSLDGLRIGQYYDVLTSSANPEHMAIGAQDQGYQLTNGLTQDDDLYEAEQVISGDYGHLTSGDGTHAYVYSVYPGFVLVQHGETAPTLSYLDFPGGETHAPWLPPIVADPTDPTAFYFPGGHLWKYTKTGPGTWASAIWSAQDFRVASDEYISRLAFSPVDPTRAWAITSYGRAWYSDDSGVTWAMSTSMVADDNWYYGQAIAPSRTDADTVTIGGSGYGVPAVYRSTDGGRTFRPWADGLPDTLVYTLVEASDDSGTVLAGTQTAAYRRDAGDTAWRDVTNGSAPITIYWDAEALEHENTVRFATYGRGVWDYQLDPEGAECWPGEDDDGDGSACEVDCDDADATVFPGATEACDGVDQDCDPATPIGGEDDADTDGARACADCDDLDPVRYPAAPELCGDGIDEDCDGVDPACEPAEDPGEDPPEEGDKGGCGCDTPSGGSWVGALAALALLRRRRS